MARPVLRLMRYRGWPQGSALGPLLSILYISAHFHIVGDYIVGYADHKTIYAVISRSLSNPQVMKLLNQDLLVIDSWCSKRYSRLNPRS